jgi:hypothetical protein
LPETSYQWLWRVSTVTIMAVKRKVSVSLALETLEAAKAAAEAEGLSLSAWLDRAALWAAKIEDGRRAVREYEAEHGPFSEEEERRADEILDRYGVGR